MRTLSFIGALATLCWLAPLASAQNYRDTTGDLINPEKAINQSPNNTHIQLGDEQTGTGRSYRAGSFAPGAAAQAGQQNQGDQWRFRFHNGQWWYYLPAKNWVVWNGSRWTEPTAQAGSMQNRTNANQQPHQSGYRGTETMNQQPALHPAPMIPQVPAATTQNRAVQTQPVYQSPATTPADSAKPVKPAPKTPAASDQK